MLWLNNPALVWQPYFPPQQIYAAATVLAALAVAAAWRQRLAAPRLAWLALTARLVVILALTVLLMGPSRVPESTDEGRPQRVTLLVDTSASMQTRDAPEGSRIEYLIEHWLDPGVVASMAAQADVRVLGFDENARVVLLDQLRRQGSAAAEGSRTRLDAAVSTALDEAVGRSVGAIVVLSDGRDTEQAELAGLGRRGRMAGVPIHVAPVGGPTLRRDVRVRAEASGEYFWVNEPGRILVRLYQVGASNESVRVRLTGPGVDEQRAVRFESAASAETEFEVTPQEAGIGEYVVKAMPLEGESEVGNNKASLFIEATGERLRVLLLEGEPYWDTKFLAQSLRRDERIELVAISVINRQKLERIVTRADQQQAQVPRTVDEFTDYDVVVLGRGVEHFLDESQAEAMVSYVGQRGGRLVFARGPAYDPQTAAGRAIGRVLAPVEPVVFGVGEAPRSGLVLTEEGRSHPVFAFLDESSLGVGDVTELPTMTHVYPVDRTKVLTRVLARTGQVGRVGGSGQPVMVSMPHERGEVFAVLGEGLWRWALRAGEHSAQRLAFDRFWSNAVRWLVLGSSFQPGEPFAVRLNRRTVRVGDSVLINVASRLHPIAEAQVEIQIERPDGSVWTGELPTMHTEAMSGRLRWRVQQPGRHEVRAIARRAGGEPIVLKSPFSAYEIDIERLHCAADPAALRQLAEESGGQVFDAGDPGQFVRLLQRRQASLSQPVRPELIWVNGLAMVTLLGWAGGEWILRRKGGLL